jgi:4'-phosphopantetheinyl transferase EntD
MTTFWPTGVVGGLTHNPHSDTGNNAKSYQRT